MSKKKKKKNPFSFLSLPFYIFISPNKQTLWTVADIWTLTQVKPLATLARLE
jgi:hypothetical protein